MAIFGENKGERTIQYPRVQSERSLYQGLPLREECNLLSMVRPRFSTARYDLGLYSTREMSNDITDLCLTRDLQSDNTLD